MSNAVTFYSVSLFRVEYSNYSSYLAQPYFVLANNSVLAFLEAKISRFTSCPSNSVSYTHLTLPTKRIV